jgi:two-component system NtrC family response regulator
LAPPDIRKLVPGGKGQLKVLLVGSYTDDFLEVITKQRDYAVDLIWDSGQAVAAAGELQFDIVVTGLRIQPADGMEVMRAFHAVDPDAPLIMSTHETSPRRVVEVMQAGAFDYIVEPYQDFKQVRAIVDRAAERRRTLLATRRLSQELHAQTDLPEIVGRSAATRRLRESLRRAAAADSPVLVTGESGTGKGLVARCVHEAGPRGGGAFVTVNCGAIPEQLLESELFGHVRGAFTGAVSDRRGRVQQAHGGSLFLDEIAELSPNAQVKLLRFIEEHSFERVGESESLSADVRIICATNRNLPARIASGLFREDLFYRVNVLSVHIPPLRERREDVPLLALHFLEKMAEESGKQVRAISPHALEILSAQEWPGNARELRNVLERAFVFSSGDAVLARDIPLDVPVAGGAGSESEPRAHPAPPLGLRERLRAEERRLILEALEACDWVRTRTSKRLKIPRSTLIRKMQELGITR